MFMYSYFVPDGNCSYIILYKFKPKLAAHDPSCPNLNDASVHWASDNIDKKKSIKGCACKCIDVYR